jgi:hypothetical protein
MLYEACLSTNINQNQVCLSSKSMIFLTCFTIHFIFIKRKNIIFSHKFVQWANLKKINCNEWQYTENTWGYYNVLLISIFTLLQEWGNNFYFVFILDVYTE